MIQYCKRCCLPSTKPHLAFDEEGICNACRNYENRKNVDWDERKKELMAILDRYRWVWIILRSQQTVLSAQN